MPLLEKDLNELPSGLSGLLHWAAAHDIFCALDGTAAVDPDYAFPTLFAVGACRQFRLSPAHSLTDLDTFLRPSEVGYVVQVGYGLKDHIEPVTSRHVDPIGFPPLFVFEPAVLIRLVAPHTLTIQSNDPEQTWQEIRHVATSPAESPVSPLIFSPRCGRELYIEQLQQVRSHLLRGDCYELNYCQEFYSEGVTIDPVAVYQQLSAIVQAPFACLYRHQDCWLIGASPERFLKKTGDHLESRPMKGTAPRHADPQIDRQRADALRASAKDRSENIMVVDLVRNDLARVAARGSVSVESLCALHPFPQVHQLVSTVRAQLRSGVSFSEILRACFPMGSMTGAPKFRVMELTDQYELGARGLYSGSVGYLDPSGDFDLNVVIRSLQYNDTTRYLSYHVGSGITAYSDPETEWEECGWKAAGIRQVFGNG